MCGIAGFLTVDTRLLESPSEAARRMAAAIAHRGPDDCGAWSDADAGVALGHRRLAILDLSPAGHQPMRSDSGRYVIAFNGEIYNHLEIRRELEALGRAPVWRGHSDTETLLASFEQWGIESTLKRTVGMFAIALWDRSKRTLHLARDRMGEKPLYYGWTRSGFVFGSELKALRALDDSPFEVSRGALAQYLRFMYVPAPRSIYENVFKLEPGCRLALRTPAPSSPPAQPLRPPAKHGSVELHRWWSLGEQVEVGAGTAIDDEVEVLDRLDSALRDAVRLQSLADVPLGAFLSGGVDSSTIVALMQQQAQRPVRTFTVGFEDASFDESPHARAVARHLGAEHNEMFLTSADARDVIPQLHAMYDEPFADSSQIPTHLVCRAARQQVTVALSGDAGDELFGGYNRYFWGPRVWKHVGWMPFGARRLLGSALRTVPVAQWDAAHQVVGRLVPGLGAVARVGDKAHKLAARLHTVRAQEDLYTSLVSEWPDPASVLNFSGTPEPGSLLDDPLPNHGLNDPRLRMMYRDALTYLPDDILCKVDRAAMAVSLETRVPLLDHRVVELAWRLPVSMKIRGGTGKWALRQVLYKYVPRELIERPKAGFGVPIGDWLKGPLRAWADDLLSPDRLSTQGYFKPLVIQRTWQEHLSGKRDWTNRLWAVLMFQDWLERNYVCGRTG